MAKILVVDDEPILLDTLRPILRRAGYQVLAAIDGEAALKVAREEAPDLIILDVVLPKIDGVEVCRILRRESSIPILFLTMMGSQVDKVLGLESGADDYLTKPFDAFELLARVKAMLRRVGMNHGVEDGPGREGEPPTVGRLRAGDLELDLILRRASRAGSPLKLAPKEFDLLAFLVHHRGEILSQDRLLREVWGYDDVSDTRTVMVHVRCLRQKLEADPSRPRLIETVRGAGYLFSG